jgi:uncharacterized protein YfaT (DUF1175 family)
MLLKHGDETQNKVFEKFLVIYHTISSGQNQRFRDYYLLLKWKDIRSKKAKTLFSADILK